MPVETVPISVKETSNDVTFLANGYRETRRRWWNGWTKGGLILAGLAGLTYLALLPWSLPACTLSVVYPALASTAIVGGGVSVMGAMFGGTKG